MNSEKKSREVNFAVVLIKFLQIIVELSNFRDQDTETFVYFLKDNTEITMQSTIFD